MCSICCAGRRPEVSQNGNPGSGLIVFLSVLDRSRHRGKLSICPRGVVAGTVGTGDGHWENFWGGLSWTASIWGRIGSNIESQRYCGKRATKSSATR